jgi:hypothetical protein
MDFGEFMALTVSKKWDSTVLPGDTRLGTSRGYDAEHLEEWQMGFSKAAGFWYVIQHEFTDEKYPNPTPHHPKKIQPGWDRYLDKMLKLGVDEKIPFEAAFYYYFSKWEPQAQKVQLMIEVSKSLSPKPGAGLDVINQALPNTAAFADEMPLLVHKLNNIKAKICSPAINRPIDPAGPKKDLENLEKNKKDVNAHTKYLTHIYQVMNVWDFVSIFPT